MHVADAFTPGATTAEAARALAVRAGFMEALVRDPRVIRLLTSWVNQLVRWDEGVKANGQARRLVLKPKGSLLRLVLEELELSWAWLPVEIMHVFHRMVQLKEPDPAAALARPTSVGVAAPPLSVTFATGDGETTEQAWARLQALCADVRAEFDRATKELARGWAPKDGARLRTWGRWYYEARVAHPPKTIMALAIDNHRRARHPGLFGDHDCRKQVRDGIKQAGRLLGLGAYTLRPPGEIRRR
jgi:hypothetical protein